MLSLVTRPAPVSTSLSTGSPLIALDQSVKAKRRHLLRELRDRGVLFAFSDRPVGPVLAAAEIKADQDDLVIELGVLDRLWQR